MAQFPARNFLARVVGAPFVLASGLLALQSAYLVTLSVAALVRRPLPPPGPGRRRFAILVPAHDEEAVIGRLLSSLARLDYPRERFEVHVVADNCSDETAAIARALGAFVHERHDERNRGKGHALSWLLRRLQATDTECDAYVVIDADSTVTPALLRRFDARLQAGSDVIQAYYAVLNADASPVAALRQASLAALHYLRPLGRASLGLSVGLKGNGMCFAAPVLERFGWSWFTLAEDVELHLALVRAGLRVDFAPEATVLAEMPVTLAQSETQHTRWERGRLEMLRSEVPSLVADGLRGRSPLMLDAAVEQSIPPLSVGATLALLCLVVTWTLRLPAGTWLAGAALVGQAAHLLTGLALTPTGWRVYAALAYAPVYLVWKIGLYVRALATRRAPGWVRTARGV